MFKPLCSMLAFVAISTISVFAFAAESKIYKTVDKYGNVVFTDVAPNDSSATVEVQPANSFPAPSSPRAASRAPSPPPAQDLPGYEHIAITSPTNELAVRDNAGNLSVSVELDPGLNRAQGHELQLLMDGSPLSNAAGSSFALANVDRGTHRLLAQVVDADGKAIITSEPITFHMLRASQIKRGRP
jgi:hypothetical protein